MLNNDHIVGVPTYHADERSTSDDTEPGWHGDGIYPGAARHEAEKRITHAGHARSTLYRIHHHRHHRLPLPLNDTHLAQDPIDTMASGNTGLLR